MKVISSVIFACILLLTPILVDSGAFETIKDIGEKMMPRIGVSEGTTSAMEIQEKMIYPVDKMTLYMVDIHFFSGNLNHQYIAHHFCSFIAKGFQQCALFDSADENGHMIGTEFVIASDIFEALPEEEKPLWHSHVYEVKSGLLVTPNLNEQDEWEVMKMLVGTYGKVIDVWHDGDDRPLGSPLLANALSLDTQVDWELADEMDRVLGVPTTHKQRRQQREAIPTPDKAAGADSYLITGKAPQFKIYMTEMENNGKVFLGNIDDKGCSNP